MGAVIIQTPSMLELNSPENMAKLQWPVRQGLRSWWQGTARFLTGNFQVNRKPLKAFRWGGH